MNSAQVFCGKCKVPLPQEMFNLPELAPCPTCGVPQQVEVFPALFRPVAASSAGEKVVEETEASCFYHPRKKAVLPCESCGRFLCALCDCELNGLHLCPNCVEAGKKKGKIKSLENHRVRYDGIALALAIWPIIFFYLTIITAPLSIFTAIRHWNSPTSIVQKTRLRFVVAILISSLEIIVWITVFYFLLHRKNRHR